jgi:hypothetical protein
VDRELPPYEVVFSTLKWTGPSTLKWTGNYPVSDSFSGTSTGFEGVRK